MPTVKITRHLQRFFPTLSPTDNIPATTVAELLHELERRHPGLAAYLVDERWRLRQHVNIFIGDGLVRDRETLQDAVGENERVTIMQALSGG